MLELVIPDIHTKWEIAEKYIELYGPQVDHIVCLGDYFDDFNDGPKSNAATAEWIKTHLYDPKFTFLLGNHDQHYSYGDKLHYNAQCSGYTRNKHRAISKVLGIKDWDEFELYRLSGRFLYTHAGYTQYLARQVVKVGRNFKTQIEKARMDVKIRMYNDMIAPGYSRGGNEPVGGLLWCDFNDDFKPIPGLCQVFGHTRAAYPHMKANFNHKTDTIRQWGDTKNWCVDTNLTACCIVNTVKETLEKVTI